MGEQPPGLTVGAGRGDVHRVEAGGGEQVGVGVGADEGDALRGGFQAEAGPELGGELGDSVQPCRTEQEGAGGQCRAGVQQCRLIPARGDLPGQEGAVEGGEPLEFVTVDVEADEDGGVTGKLAQATGEIHLGARGPGKKGIGQVCNWARCTHDDLF